MKMLGISGLIAMLLLSACGGSSVSTNSNQNNNTGEVKTVEEVQIAPSNPLPPLVVEQVGGKNDLESIPSVEDNSAVKIIDADNDTFSSERDCNDNDATVFPEAYEWIGDGINQDCDKKKYTLLYAKQFSNLSCNHLGNQNNQDTGSLESIFDSSDLTIFGKMLLPAGPDLLSYFDPALAVIEQVSVLPDIIKSQLYYSDFNAAAYQLFSLYGMNKDIQGKSHRTTEIAAIVYVYNLEQQLVEVNYLVPDKGSYQSKRHLLYAYNPDLSMRYMAEVESTLGKVNKLRSLSYYNIPDTIKESIKTKAGYSEGLEYNLSVLGNVSAVKVKYILATELYPSFEGNLQDFLNNPPITAFKSFYQNHADPAKPSMVYQQKTYTMELSNAAVPVVSNAILQSSLAIAYDENGQRKMIELQDAKNKPYLCTVYTRQTTAE